MVKFFLLLVFTAVSLLSMTARAGSDLEKMTRARSLYAKGSLQDAIRIYSEITPASDFWLEALEERVWAYTRQGQFENALGDLQSITSPVWETQVGPETYMLSTFVSLKICAYKDVVKKIDLFKKRMLPRVETLQKIAKGSLPNTQFWALAESVKAGKVTMASLGLSADKFPRYFYRDQRLLSSLKSGNNNNVEDRLKQLAQSDLKEIQANLKKMKILEVELIQTVLTADKDQKVKSSDLKFSQLNRDKVMTFPVSDDEVWIDEVGRFQVKANKCPYNNLRSSL